MAVGTSLAIGAGIAAIAKGTSALMAKKHAKDELEKQEQAANDAKLALEELEANRQEVMNPYGEMANEYENLGVATGAAQFQAEQADIALANTLDTIRQTGGGAGGATALARMALESKRGISNSIETQEKSNNEARAAGAEKVAGLKAEGEAWKWAAQEGRDVAKLDRLQSQQDNAEALGRQAEAMKVQANMDMMGAVGDMAGSLTKGLTGGAGDTLGGLLQSN